MEKLETERLILRNFLETDYDDLYYGRKYYIKRSHLSGIFRGDVFPFGIVPDLYHCTSKCGNGEDSIIHVDCCIFY